MTRWQGDDIVIHATKKPSAIWAVLVSASLALAVSHASSRWKDPVGDGLWTLFLISITLSALNLANGFIALYGERFKLPRHAITVATNVARTAILVIALLTWLSIWGAPTAPLLLLLAVAILIAALALRDTFPNILAWIQINATSQVKEGDYIKLETGEEGYVTEIDWKNTILRTLAGDIVLVPHRKLARSTIINYGRPLKRARQPFQFHTRLHLKELTGLRARNLRELADVLKKVPESVVYYHTHHFLEEHHYLTPEPASDFALWVDDALGDVVLGETLAAIDTFQFRSLGALQERLVNIIEEHLAQGEHGQGHRDADPGREFHFIRSVSIILPTAYVAHDMREFVESLRKLSLESLYFHIFESRLRLGKGLNDFSAWLSDALDENELADRIARLDPYTYTLEGLRSSLIQLIEKRIK